MIRGFRDRVAEAIFMAGDPALVRRFPADARDAAKRKLVSLAAATELKDLRSPPGNRLEALKGKGQGKHSLRINDRWRVVFTWNGSNADDVEIVDYH